MAKKISQLTQATEVKSDDVTVIVQDGETKKLPLNMMVTKQDIENKKIVGLAKLDEIEATYENDTYTPTITVKNKSSVKTGEGDEVDYSANVMDGHVKSAILTGQTLVNLIPEGKQSSFHINNTNGGGYGFWDNSNVNMIKPSTKYLIITNVTLNTGSKIIITNNESYASCFTDSIVYQQNEIGIKKTILSSKSDLSNCTSILRSYTRDVGEVKGTIQVFEYQDGMENWDIPYFTGMQSVKMPVLTTSNEDGTKTNILHTPEEVVLRSLPNGVKDTLNLNTGEYTQRIGEITFNGSEEWSESASVSQNHYCAYTSVEGSKNELSYNIVCNSLPVRNILSATIDYEGCMLNKWNSGDMANVIVKIANSKLSSTSVKGIKAYLQSNPLTVQYELATPIVKSVDLIPSGTHPSTTPYCWKDGHIQLSSSGLLPSLEYSVVTSRAGQISQNAAMIVKNDKRIFDLEILLAGGLVNTTYQALTLQNQVETGLSKVSLNSETEPDYLLYHMIMKLIEEKAYKLDDLTEKVSVFYLYEKLSDEQFETIYSALYPFVEDEIVEEPVVEELPEVVEDEVVM
jgi:hypothetical protein